MSRYQSDLEGWSNITLGVQLLNPKPITTGTSLVRELPLELIEKIIRFFLESLPGTITLPLDAGSCDPRLRITQVCATWRTIAFRIYDLWELAVPGNNPSSGSCNLVHHWFRQIPSSHLSLTITAGDIITNSKGRTTLDDLVVPYRNRIRKLDVTLAINDLQRLLCPPENSFHNLEILHLQLIGAKQSISDTNISSLFINSPILRELSSTSGHGSLIETCFPWAQLTNIVIVSADGISLGTADCFLVLSNGTSLVNISLSFISPTDSSAEAHTATLQTHPLCLPNVKKLRLNFSCSDPGPFLLLLEFPGLTHLTLGSLNLVHWGRTSHQRFFEPFAQRLEYFETNNNYIFVELDDKILSWMPNLRSINLGRDYRLTSTTLQKIGSGKLLPKAENLEFSARDVSLVIKMMSERQRISKSPGNMIASVRGIHVYARTWQVDDEYWKLRAQGVNIRLSRM